MDAFDADALIYAAVPGHPLGLRVAALFRSAGPGPVAGTGSVLLLPEVLGRPLRDGAVDEVRVLAGLLARLDLRPVDLATAELATALSSRYRLKAIDATHLATEFLCRFREDRRPYPAISLTANGEFMTAVCNDYHADEIFARQVRGLAEKGDVLIAITTSGNSRNVLRALEEARLKGVDSIAFLGRDGGFTRGIATIDLIVPGTVTARIQEGQKVLFHALCEIVEEKLPKA